MSNHPTLRLKTGIASKIGPRGTGGIHYQLSTDADRKRLYVTVTANDGGGCFSREDVEFASVVKLLKGIDTEEPFGSPVFRPVFTGRSTNNAGFLAAILRTEGVLQAEPERVHLHRLAADPAAWMKQMLELPGEPLPPPEEEEGGEEEPPTPPPEPAAAPGKKRRSKKQADEAEAES
ncbi:hypothetical protein SAMN04488038_10787 [Solimonas aquatica]|uniref:Uncharacterized protein n=1 Tax=Solimonas aquatica TaxID=489703 RepID=A0A1H9GIH5_9GAMM|nr:hypothetical protein [Solimonas aquatica]SEQ49882.1 hypothetical protein SAMN04488038_10787 [Solimonas aquatica]